MTDDIVARLRAAFDAVDIPTKNIAIRKAADNIERLRAARVKIMQKCPYAKKDQWCAGLNCNCIIARAALAGEKTDD